MRKMNLKILSGFIVALFMLQNGAAMESQPPLAPQINQDDGSLDIVLTKSEMELLHHVNLDKLDGQLCGIGLDQHNLERRIELNLAMDLVNLFATRPDLNTEGLPMTIRSIMHLIDKYLKLSQPVHTAIQNTLIDYAKDIEQKRR